MYISLQNCLITGTNDDVNLKSAFKSVMKETNEHSICGVSRNVSIIDIFST